MVLLLSDAEVASLLAEKESIDAVEQAFVAQARGDVGLPHRTVLTVGTTGGVLLGMPAYVGGVVGALGTKIVASFPRNREVARPTIMGLMCMSDPATGAPIAVMGAASLTAARTGATSAVATKYLARPDAHTMGLIGAGVQGEAQVRHIAAIRELDRVFVYDVDFRRSEELVSRLRDRVHASVASVRDPRDAVTDVDIVATATTSTEPVLLGDWLRPGQHVNAVGAHDPKARELDSAAVAKATLVTDLSTACLAEAGDILLAIADGSISAAHIHADLADVVTGRKPGRQDANEITVFKSVGLAIEDVGLAAQVIRMALEREVGRELEL